MRLRIIDWPLLVREIRAERKSTLENLGKAIGTNNTAVCQWESGAIPRISFRPQLKSIADELGLRSNGRHAIDLDEILPILAEHYSKAELISLLECTSTNLIHWAEPGHIPAQPYRDRAIALMRNLGYPCTKPRPWSQEELQTLHEIAENWNFQTVYKTFRRKHPQRTQKSLIEKLFREGYSTSARYEEMPLRDWARVLGISYAIMKGWIDQGLLKPERVINNRPYVRRLALKEFFWCRPDLAARVSGDILWAEFDCNLPPYFDRNRNTGEIGFSLITVDALVATGFPLEMLESCSKDDSIRLVEFPMSDTQWVDPVEVISILDNSQTTFHLVAVLNDAKYPIWRIPAHYRCQTIRLPDFISGHYQLRA